MRITISDLRNLCRVLCSLAFAGLLSAANAEEHRVTADTDLVPLCKEVVAGDSIILAGGTWTDSELEFEGLAGTAEKPISIMAETAGSVVLAGKTEFRVSGQHVVVSGLVFKDCVNVDNV